MFTDRATTKLLKTIDPKSEAAQKVIAALESKQQWVHACLLINGVRARNGVEAFDYFYEVTMSIRDRYGKDWVDVVVSRFDEINQTEEQRQAIRQR